MKVSNEVQDAMVLSLICKLHAEMLAKKFTYASIAKATRMSQLKVSRIMSLRIRPAIADIAKIATCLGVVVIAEAVTMLGDKHA